MYQKIWFSNYKPWIFYFYFAVLIVFIEKLILISLYNNNFKGATKIKFWFFTWIKKKKIYYCDF